MSDLTDKQARILREMIDYLDQNKGQPPGYATCGTMAGLLGYKGTPECPSGRIAGGVLGRLRKQGLVEKSDIGHGPNESAQMTVAYRPTPEGRRLLRDYEYPEGDVYSDSPDRLYWTSWYSRASQGWGFPWFWTSGYTADDRIILVGLIAAPTQQEAWDKATWAVPLDEKRFIEEVDDDYRPSGRFPPKGWWPDPKVVWQHLEEEGWDKQFWEQIEET